MQFDFKTGYAGNLSSALLADSLADLQEVFV